MSASSFIRAVLTGLMTIWLVACGGGDDTPEIGTPDIAQELEPDLPLDSDLASAPVNAPEAGVVGPVTEPEVQTAMVTPLIERRPPCGGSSTCVNAGSISGGHGDPGVELYFDPERNDAIVRWGNALGEMMDCADGGETIATCVGLAPVEQSCKDEFDRLVGLANELAAFDAVFLTAGSPCRPEEGQQ